MVLRISIINRSIDSDSPCPSQNLEKIFENNLKIVGDKLWRHFLI